MDIFFQDPTEVPLPAEEVRIRELRAQSYPDGQRVRVYLEVDPFQRRPSADLVIRDSSGLEAANTSIVESMYRTMEITMHLRHPEPGDVYTLSAVVFFVPQPPEGEQPDPRQHQVVDSREITFTTPPAHSSSAS
jgi:hypothetical protein